MTLRGEARSFRVSEGGERLDKVVCARFGVGRRAVRSWCRTGLVLLDGRPAASGTLLSGGETVTVLQAGNRGDATALKTAAARVVWSRGGILAIAKPAGMHSVRGRAQPSVAEFLAALHPGIEHVGDEAAECGLLHRLDRDTSGILLAATDQPTYREMRAAFARGEVRKDYLALVRGSVAGPIEIAIPLARSARRVHAARPGERAWAAKTRIEPLERGAAWSLVQATMTTGVTHQIRAHLALAGHPVIGDVKYATDDGEEEVGEGQRLHALSVHVAGRFAVSTAPDSRFLVTLAKLRALRWSAADAPVS